VPLFDENAPQSEEAAAIYTARTLLSQTTALQQLLEAADAATAKLLIIPGPLDPPVVGETFTIDELEGRIAYCQIHPPFDDSLLVGRSRAVGAVSEKEGLFRLHVRRQIREAEYKAVGGRRDVWLYFLDRTSRMCEQFIEAADLNLASQQIKRAKGPLFNPQEDHAAQGIHLWADFVLSWGGSENVEQ